MIPIEPRPLNNAERVLLEHILRFDGIAPEEWCAQLDQVEVVGVQDERSASIWLGVAGTGRASEPNSALALNIGVVDAEGREIGALIVWAEDGVRLAGLDCLYDTDALPPLEHLRISLSPDPREP
ncbi:hypothetical protein IMZ11_40295 [Microtetraspora sp. AC03309]|uniref:hypothetical protein n=1 Tax=Microtetraspora sp. AC03309 TaxID=2779376 RepID=UPI001E2C96F3|nr:hypothetical protein [Microtetraspora sp. AC03309]MCC5581861.1 hypothetical protein [Microtetraspora sp. AC03309]